MEKSQHDENNGSRQRSIGDARFASAYHGPRGSVGLAGAGGNASR
jgi:hypothetical protein